VTDCRVSYITDVQFYRIRYMIDDSTITRKPSYAREARDSCVCIFDAP